MTDRLDRGYGCLVWILLALLSWVLIAFMVGIITGWSALTW